MTDIKNKFYTKNGKRLVLVVDDEIINREMLGTMLKESYDVIYAENGQEAMRIIRDNINVLSLILLDLIMPVMSGYDVLKKLKSDPELKRIPVIVMTADQDAEIASLDIGAADFIPKPYPKPGVILARILRVIELSEDRQIIQSTERDPLTGLFNIEYFYRYAEKYDQYHKETPMDAIILDINHFHIINDRFGNAYGDDVLRRISACLSELAHEKGGIVGRRESDTFMIYIPSGADYQNIYDMATQSLSEKNDLNNRIRLRMGVYENVEKGLEIERRFDRAKIAADTVKSNYSNPIGLYDKKLYDEEVYSEQLIEDFNSALEENQFKVYFQPKYNITGKRPVLSSAEALVRWQHPKLGMVNPAVFINLFEENGLIQKLDNHVWKTVAEKIREWKNKYGFSPPVSVNVSRIDMYDPNLIPSLQKYLSDNDLSVDDLYLEITESAYTEDSEQILATVVSLRALGFRVEMDDFGTGYSSLNMLSTIPIDALKIDMQFVRNAFRERHDTRMLEVIIDIASHLSVPVIAEGIETEEQLITLKELGCEIVQGYYFSKPLPPEEFESFIRKEIESSNAEQKTSDDNIPQENEPEENSITSRLKSNVKKPEYSEKSKGIPLKTVSITLIFLAVFNSLLLIVFDYLINIGYKNLKDSSSRYIFANISASDLETISDYLTDKVRCFTVTGNPEYAKEFFEEVEVSKRRDQAVNNLKTLLNTQSSKAYESLSTALDYSNELVKREYLAMRLAQQAYDISENEMPEAVSSLDIPKEFVMMDKDELKDKAIELVFDNYYMSFKEKVKENVRTCTDELIKSSSLDFDKATNNLNVMLSIQIVLTIIMLTSFIVLAVFIVSQVRVPLTRMVDQMSKEKYINPTGASELRFVSKTYNDMLERTKQTNIQLTYEATHDPLTGLFNRGAYDILFNETDNKHIALLIIDVYKFKSINDNYGHYIGDKVLKKVAKTLKQLFRSVDIISRIGGDEFAVIMTRMDSSLEYLVHEKVNKANELLKDTSDGLPEVLISVGAAFSDRKKPENDIFNDADSTLYKVKNTTGYGCMIHE